MIKKKKAIPEEELSTIRVKEFALRKAFEAIGVNLSDKKRLGVTTVFHPWDDTKDDVFDILSQLGKQGKELKENERMQTTKKYAQKAVTMGKIDSLRGGERNEITAKISKKIISMQPREVAAFFNARRKKGEERVSLSNAFVRIKEARIILNRIGYFDKLKNRKLG